MNLKTKHFLDIVKNLPETIRSNYVEIWKEYQEENSSESKIVHQIDRLEMVLQAKTYEKEGGFEEEQDQTFFRICKKGHY